MTVSPLIDEEDLIGQKAREHIIQSHPMQDDELKASKEHLGKIARTTLSKKKIHIGVTTHVLSGIKKLANRKGMPYQVFINTILHDYVQEKSA